MAKEPTRAPRTKIIWGSTINIVDRWSEMRAIEKESDLAFKKLKPDVLKLLGKSKELTNEEGNVRLSLSEETRRSVNIQRAVNSMSPEDRLAFFDAMVPYMSISVAEYEKELKANVKHPAAKYKKRIDKYTEFSPVDKIRLVNL